MPIPAKGSRAHDERILTNRTRSVFMRASRFVAGLVVTATLGVAALSAAPAIAQSDSRVYRPTIADPQASQATQNLLSLLNSLRNKGVNDTNHRVLSGQAFSGQRFASQSNGANAAANIQLGWDEAITATKNKTNWTPKIVDADYFEYSSAEVPGVANVAAFNADRRAKQNQLAIQHAQQGGIVQISWHARNPWTGAQASSAPQGSLADITNPSTAAGANWKAQLDRIAASLQQLQSAGVPVMFRPFHEMNGTWFWWGNAGTGDFNRIWNHMFDYFTATKGLHNLLWVFSANHDDEGIKAADYYYTSDLQNQYGQVIYRGTANRVDVLGLDAYSDTSPSGTTFSMPGYEKLMNKSKPFGLTEYGPRAQVNGSFDQLEVLDVIVPQAKYPKTVFTVAYNNPSANYKMSLADTTNGKAFLDSGAVVVRESTLP
jgi:mannan endo-1,4-beta-mannosidase